MIDSSAPRWHWGFHLLLIKETMQGKHGEEDVGLLGLLSRAAVHANTTQTIGELFAWYWGELWHNSPTYARLNISQCLTLAKGRPTH